MITLHIYCSYKLSTGGFQYGTFQFTPQSNGTRYFLTEENKLEIVSTAFDYSYIKKIKGKIPQKDSYLFLLKKINYQYEDDHNDFGRDITMNMAFEFDEFNEYTSFIHSFEESKKNSPKQLARELADCIIPDISITKYKLSIDKTKFDLWLNSKLNQNKSSQNNTNTSKRPTSLFITTDSSEKDFYREDLLRDFDFIYRDTEEDFVINHKENTPNYRIDPVKKKRIGGRGKNISEILQEIKTAFSNVLSQLKRICRKNRKYLIFFLILCLIIITIIICFE